MDRPTLNIVFVQNKFSFVLYSYVILNLYIVYELNTWPRNPTNNFLLKNHFFGTFKLVRNIIKSKFSYNDSGIAFDREDSWSFDNDFARNIIIFGVSNSSSSYAHNRKNNSLVLVEGPTHGLNDSPGVSELTS